VIRRLARQFLILCGVAIGAHVIVFTIFDSGLLGDPARIEVGRHADASSLGAARVRLGLLAAFEPRALRLRLEGPPQRLGLRDDRDALLCVDDDGTLLRRWPYANRDCAALAAAMEAAPPPGCTLRATALRPELPARGCGVALDDLALDLDAGRTLELAWAEPRPAWRRFCSQGLALLRFDLGRSRDGLPIAASLRSRGLRSLAFALPAFLLTTALALLAALACALRRGHLDRLLGTASAAMLAISSLVWILFLQRWLAADLGLFPVYGWAPPYLHYLALPILIWVLVGFAPEFRFWRALAVEESERPYLRTARAKGLSPARVLLHHLLPNLGIQLLNRMLVALPFLMLGSLLLERFFGIPGLGSWTVEAIQGRDAAVLRAITFLSALAFLLAQWLADFAAAWADPRLRRKS